MAQVGSRGHDPIPIGEIAAPAFARLPEPHLLFARRAERLRALADGHELKSYLLFLAGLTAVQHAVQDGLPPAALPDADVIAHARTHAMPPLDRSRFTADPVCDATIERLVASADSLEMPAAARAALTKVRTADSGVVAEIVHAVLADSI